MAGFSVANFDFGQNIENNRIRRQQLAQQAAQANQQAALTVRGQDIQQENANANRALEQQKMEESSRQFDVTQQSKDAAIAESKRQFNEQQMRADRSFAADQKWKAAAANISERAQNWQEALNQQKMESENLRMQKFMQEMDAYDIARQKDELAVKELQERAEARANLYNKALGQAVLSCHESGGVLGENALALYNETIRQENPNDPGADFIGNSFIDPKTGMRHIIGNGENWYIGTYQRTKSGDVVYGPDGTPMTSLQPIDAGFRNTVLNSKYGQEYLESAAGRRSRINGRSYGTILDTNSGNHSVGSGVKFDNNYANALRNNLLEMEYDGQYDNQGNFIFNGKDARRKLTPDQEHELAAKKQAYNNYLWGGLGVMPGNTTGQPTPKPSTAASIASEAMGEKKNRKPVVKSETQGKVPAPAKGAPSKDTVIGKPDWENNEEVTWGTKRDNDDWGKVKDDPDWGKGKPSKVTTDENEEGFKKYYDELKSEYGDKFPEKAARQLYTNSVWKKIKDKIK